jgi:Uma2 family endonuclease
MATMIGESLEKRRHQNSAKPMTVASLPELRFGDHLPVEEFMRRWENQPGIRFAELLGGRVYMPSPVSLAHAEMEWIVGAWLLNYHASTPGTGGAHNATTFMLENVPQPDLLLRILPEYGGATSVEGIYLHGAPELIVEICQTSEAYDLHEKLDLYQEAEVREYIAVLVHTGKVLSHRLEEGSYQIASPDSDNIHRSRVFPGLWLDPAALLERMADRVLETLQRGLASPEHADFVKRLAASRQS